MFGRYDLKPAARRLLSEISPWLDSGLETFVFTRLRWLRIRTHPQVVLLGRRVDFLIGDRRVLQIDGGHHVGAQREDDIAHDALLRLHGYTVIRVGCFQVTDRWPEVQDLLLRAIAQGLHLA
ncbi:endonuclease domain-containing protein [Microbacterium rhizophilus]|uniref:endonuclease domain-containing protein n=1 Tax=Microbacterium rhizophilus TaxID=3138934 RepID=UPI0031F0C649